MAAGSGTGHSAACGKEGTLIKETTMLWRFQAWMYQHFPGVLDAWVHFTLVEWMAILLTLVFVIS
jgi:hypothetical protein